MQLEENATATLGQRVVEMCPFLTLRSKPLRLDAPKKRDQVLRVVRLLRAPEDVVDFQVVRSELDEFGDRYGLSGFGV